MVPSESLAKAFAVGACTGDFNTSIRQLATSSRPIGNVLCRSRTDLPAPQTRSHEPYTSRPQLSGDTTLHFPTHLGIRRTLRTPRWKWHGTTARKKRTCISHPQSSFSPPHQYFWLSLKPPMRRSLFESLLHGRSSNVRCGDPAPLSSGQPATTAGRVEPTCGCLAAGSHLRASTQSGRRPVGSTYLHSTRMSLWPDSGADRQFTSSMRKRL